MRARLFPVLIALSVLLLGHAAEAHAGEVGFRKIAIPNGDDPPLELGIWYPTLTQGSPQPLEFYTQDVAPDAPVSGHDLPLIIISHGKGGSLAGHYDTALALARAGFVVAAPTHTGDNWRDRSRTGRVAERPRHIHAVIDYMLSAWPERVALDPARIGVFGFSLGGFTMLVAAGGEPDLAKSLPPSYRAANAAPTPTRPAPGAAPGVWVHDPRIKAAVIAAPALGLAFVPDGLKQVTLPVQLWFAEADSVLAGPDYGRSVRDALPRPVDDHVVPGADHWDFLAPCSAALAQAARQVCGEIGGFDRTAFHRTFNAAVVAFFQAALK
jgi:predicted dienelactone hydrolase